VQPSPGTNEAEVIAFRNAAEFEAWLDANLDCRAGVWLKIAKKASGVPTLTGDEAVDVGLCYGWISRSVEVPRRRAVMVGRDDSWPPGFRGQAGSSGQTGPRLGRPAAGRD
jgi:hypothetical protein